MKVKDKLDVFTETVMEEAEEKQREILAEMASALRAACDEAEKKARRNADDIIKKEQYRIEQAKNKALIDAASKSKKSLIELRSSLIEKLEENVVGMLQEFMATNEYERYILDSIEQCVAKYKDVDITILEKDIALADKIKAITGNDVTVSDVDFIGGFKCTIKSKRALYDNTLRARLQDEMKRFNQFRITG